MFTKVLHRLRFFAPKLLLGTLLLGMLLLGPGHADAQVRRWIGPPTCNDGDSLFSRVHAPDLHIEASVIVVENRLQLRLDLERGGERWHRVVVGDSCEALIEVAVVVATMAAELELRQSEAQEPCDENCGETGGPVTDDLPADAQPLAEPLAQPLAEPLAEPLAPADNEETPQQGTRANEDVVAEPTRDLRPAASRRFEWPERWSLTAHAGARFDTLSLPSPRGAVDVGVHLRFRWLRIDVGFLATRVANITQGDASAELGLTAGRLGACGGAPLGGFWLGGCGALELGVVRALGRGVDVPRAEGSFWAGLDLALRGEVGIFRRLSLYLEAGAILPLRRPRFLLQGETVHTIPAISPRVALGFELRLTR